MAKSRPTTTRASKTPLADAIRDAQGLSGALNVAITAGEKFNSLWDPNKLRSYAGALQNVTSSIPVAGRLSGFLGEVISTTQAVGTLIEGASKLASGKLLGEIFGGEKKGKGDVSSASLPPSASSSTGLGGYAGFGGGPIMADITHPLPLPVDVVNWPGQTTTPYASSTPSAGNVLSPTPVAASEPGLKALTEKGFEVQHVEIEHPLPLQVEVTNWPGNEATPTASSVAAPPTLGEVPTLEAAESGGAEAAAGAGAILGPIGLVAGAALVAGKQLYDMGEKAVQTGFQFAAIANPATAQLYERAVLDSEAVLGQRFVPVVELATAAVRDVGDFFGEILPSAGEFRASLVEFKPALDELRDAARDVAPIIKDVLGASLKELAAGARAVTDVTKNVTLGFRALADKIGLPLGGPAVSSVGAASGSVTIGGIEDVSRKMFEAAVGQGRQIDAPIRTADTLERIEAWGVRFQSDLLGRLAIFERLMNPAEAGRILGTAIANELGFKPGWGR